MNPLETYLKEMRDIRSTGAAVEETSSYSPLYNLLNEIGKKLKPKVRCISILANRGAGSPDGGFFTPEQFQKSADAEPKRGQLPARGAFEVKSPSEDVQKIARSEQVERYLAEYKLVLVTNYRDFLLLGKDAQGKPVQLERYVLAGDEKEFWTTAGHPQKTAKEQGEQFCEYLSRVMLYNAPLSAPQDVAWFLASYARDAKARVENHKDLSALAAVREALEEALGMKFSGERGEHFFRSTLVQTIFYGVFSAWVLWHRDRPERANDFNWHEADWFLRVPFIRTLYHQIASRDRLGPLGLEEVLDWMAAALNRVERGEFFQKFQDEQAVQYFYEPFLQAFDPDLRKELGVWFTPPEIVKYQVARVDTVLREELGLADGLADPNVVVLDPCCGTGAYLVEVLRHITSTLRDKHDDALVGYDLKNAAMTRIFGFELLPAAFVVAHMQIGLLLHQTGLPLSSEKSERVAVYLTNALTGWEPPKEPKQHVMEFMQELEEEKDAAGRVKRESKILVILGNPPYNGFAGVAVDEERELSNAYRTTKQAPKPEGQGLNDLFVRFFRMGERRIVEKTGKGIVSFISNYGWLEGRSFTGMREKYLEVFDQIFIDCMNGDKYKTGKLTPTGESDPSVFSTELNHEGIQVGTAIAILVRKQKHKEAKTVLFRNFWGKDKRTELLASLEGKSNQYQSLEPSVEIGYPFKPAEIEEQYLFWPLLPQLMPVSYPGIKTSRDPVVVDIDRDRLTDRMQKYFDPNITHEEMHNISPISLTDASGFKAKSTRDYLLKRGFLSKNIVYYCYRPFDTRWIYWEPETKLLDRNRADYFHNVFTGNISLSAAQQNRKAFDPPFVSRNLCSLHLIERGANIFPLFLKPSSNQALFLENDSKESPKLNLSEKSFVYINSIGYEDQKDGAEAIFFCIIAILHSPMYRKENDGALRQDWPRIPLPDSRKALEKSAVLGCRIAALLDTETEVSGVTAGKIDPLLRSIGVPFKVGGGELDPNSDDFAITADWGHAGKGGATMPGKGRIVSRSYDKAELEAIEKSCESQKLSAEQIISLLGETTCDIFLNDKAFWKNIPINVWEYYIGGYQVIKKWLSYREEALLGRALKADEAREVMNMARRLAAIVLLQPALDENYKNVKEHTYAWPGKA